MTSNLCLHWLFYDIEWCWLKNKFERYALRKLHGRMFSSYSKSKFVLSRSTEFILKPSLRAYQKSPEAPFWRTNLSEKWEYKLSLCFDYEKVSHSVSIFTLLARWKRRQGIINCVLSSPFLHFAIFRFAKRKTLIFCSLQGFQKNCSEIISRTYQVFGCVAGLAFMNFCYEEICLLKLLHSEKVREEFEAVGSIWGWRKYLRIKVSPMDAACCLFLAKHFQNAQQAITSGNIRKQDAE